MTKKSVVFETEENRFEAVDSSWKNLYRVSAIAALIAALVFRRNIGAEISLFAGQTQPNTVVGWFTLIQNNSLLGLSFLGVFDLVDYAHVGVMFLALYVVLRRTDRKLIAIATVFNFAGIAIYFISNSAMPMLILSNQYAAATTETQRETLLAEGQAVLKSGFNQGVAYQNVGVYLSLLLLAVAGLFMSVVMLRRSFGKITAYAGILASALDLAFIVGS